MKIVITDSGIYPGKLTKEDLLIHNRCHIETCTHCQSCWIKTPGRCVHHDHLQNIGYFLAHCDELVIVSRFTYGGASAFVQRCIERMRPYFLPTLVGQGDSKQNANRYRNEFSIHMYFYREDLTPEEIQTAEKYVKHIGEKFDVNHVETHFASNAVQVGDLS